MKISEWIFSTKEVLEHIKRVSSHAEREVRLTHIILLPFLRIAKDLICLGNFLKLRLCTFRFVFVRMPRQGLLPVRLLNFRLSSICRDLENFIIALMICDLSCCYVSSLRIPKGRAKEKC